MLTFPENTPVSVVERPGEAYTRRTLTVDFLYLDTESCERCAGTEARLETALTQVEPVLESLAVRVVVRDIHVDTLEAAKATQLTVSPTIRIDGRDIQPDYREDACEPCSELRESEGQVECRLWRYRGDVYTTPPVELLVEALVRAAVQSQSQLTPAPEGPSDGLSANVESFFEASEPSESDCCWDCCGRSVPTAR